jgi:hypothetical protein
MFTEPVTRHLFRLRRQFQLAPLTFSVTFHLDDLFLYIHIYIYIRHKKQYIIYPSLVLGLYKKFNVT